MDVNEELKFLVRGRVAGGQGGCEQRIKIFVNTKKKSGRGVGLGGQVDVNEQVRIL